MNALVLSPTIERVEYTFFAHGRQTRQGEWLQASDMQQAARQAVMQDEPPDLVALRAPFGGTHFTAPALATEGALAELEHVADSAPLHIPRLIELVRGCRSAFASTPIVLVFETAFFTRLPLQEAHYGLAPPQAGATPMRYGRHGIFHEAACLDAHRQSRSGESTRGLRILSICLDPKPELCAVIGRTPLMVTGGATPLEGLPGHTTCGDLDPSVVLMLAEKNGWGAEQIDAVLTRESGLLGMTGKPATIEELFLSSSPEYAQSRRMLEYRLLLACGAGIGLLGGLDIVVFSGRYAHLASILGPPLLDRVSALPGLRHAPPRWYSFQTPLDQLVAEQAFAACRGVQ